MANEYLSKIEPTDHDINISFEDGIGSTGFTLGNGSILLEPTEFNSLSERMQKVIVWHEAWHSVKWRQGHNDAHPFTKHVLDDKFFDALTEEEFIQEVKRSIQ